jgi:hypothetical protein
VLKPLDMSVEALRCQADILASMACDHFRVALTIAGGEDGTQLLVRALLFRLLASRDPAAARGCRFAIKFVDGLLSADVRGTARPGQ